MGTIAKLVVIIDARHREISRSLRAAPYFAAQFAGVASAEEVATQSDDVEVQNESWTQSFRLMRLSPSWCFLIMRPKTVLRFSRPWLVTGERFGNVQSLRFLTPLVHPVTRTVGQGMRASFLSVVWDRIAMFFLDCAEKEKESWLYKLLGRFGRRGLPECGDYRARRHTDVSCAQPLRLTRLPSLLVLPVLVRSLPSLMALRNRTKLGRNLHGRCGCRAAGGLLHSCGRC